MGELPFRALLTTEPWGVFCFDRTAGVQLWRVSDWLRHRGGRRAHYADLAATRTIVVDHLEFIPSAQPSLGFDELGRRIGRVSLALAFGIAISRDEGVDETYLRRCFERDEAKRVFDALGALMRDLKGDPLPGSEATADVRAAIVHRNNDFVIIR